MSTPKRITKLIRIPAKELTIHPLVQRQLVPKHLADLKENFDLDSIGTLQAVEYAINGKTEIRIIDGQHRLKALIDLDLGDWEVDVLLHLNVKDDKAAAKRFLNHNNSRALTTYHKFRQEVIAEDEVAIGITEILERRDIKATPNQTDGGVCCFRTLKRIYLLDEGKTLGLTLDTAMDAWGRTARALDGKLLDGLSRVLRTFRRQLDHKSLVVKLAKFAGGASGVLGRARLIQDLESVSAPTAAALAIVKAYNMGRRTGRVEYHAA